MKFIRPGLFSMLRNQNLSIIGIIGLLISALLAVYAGFAGFSRLPLNTADFIWTGVYTLLTAGVIYLLYQRKYRAINRIVAAAASLLTLIIIFYSDNGPSLLAGLWLAFISAGIGNLVWNGLKLNRENDYLDRLFIGIPIGLGALALLTFGLGSAHLFAGQAGLPIRFFRLLHPIPVFAMLVLLTVIVTPGLYRTWKGRLHTLPAEISAWASHRQFKVSLTLAVLFLCFATVFIWALSPTIRFDSIVYHLAAPETYVENRGIIEVTEPLVFYMSHYGEMLFTLALIAAGQPLPGLVHLLSGLLSVGLTFLIARRLGYPRIGWIAALLFATMPILYDAGTVHNDFFVAMFSLASLYAILGWWQEQRLGWLLIAGVLAGLSIGVKINAAVPTLTGGLAILAGLVHRREAWKRSLLALVGYAAPVVLLYAPWAGVNFIWTNNPFYPFFCSLFTCPNAGVDSNVLPAGSLLQALISRFLLLPWNITMYGDQYYTENSGGAAAGVFLLSLPWLFAFKKPDQNLLKIWKGLALFSVLTFLFFIPFAQRIRYLLPAVPILCILAAINITVLWDQVKQAQKRNLLLACVLVCGLYFLSTRMVFTSSGWQISERYPYKVAMGFESPEAFLSRTIAAYDALQFLSGEGDGNHKVAAFGTESRIYTTAEIHTVYDSFEILNILDSSPSLETLAEQLKQAGYDYILYDQEGYAFSEDTRLLEEPLLSRYTEDTRLLEEPFLSRYAQLVFSRNHVELYKLVWDGKTGPSRPVVNLLVNSGFETVDESGQFPGWEQYNNPSATGVQAHSGKTAVLASDLAHLYQRVDVRPDRLYTFGHWSRSDTPGQLVRLQILWLDRHNTPIQATIEKFEAQAEWTWNQLSISAPEGAVLAQVFVTTDGENQAVFDDICFAEGPVCK